AADTRRHEPLADRLAAPLPLLELDDHRALASRPVLPTYEAVEALRREGEPVLEDDAMIVEPALLEDLRDCPERVAPRVHLTRRRCSGSASSASISRSERKRKSSSNSAASVTIPIARSRAPWNRSQSRSSQNARARALSAPSGVSSSIKGCTSSSRECCASVPPSSALP